MVRLGRNRSKQRQSPEYDGQQMIISSNPSRGDMSYITDVSSVTCPTELAMDRSSSNESPDDADVSYFSMTEVNSALTGWTSVADQSKPNAMRSRRGKGVIDKKNGRLTPINEPKSNIDEQEMSIIMDSSDDGSVEVQSITGKLKPMNAENWNPRPMSINATKGRNANNVLPSKTPASPKPPRPPSPKTTVAGNKAALKPTEGRPLSPKSALKSKASGPNVPPSPTASISSLQKKRQPVPPLKDPNMDDDEYEANWEADCNYDINPTMMFQMLEGGDWRTCIEFLDGKSSHDIWNLTNLITKGITQRQKPDVHEMKARQKELQSQARTWIVRREKSGVLRWRMLPLHAALVFNAPFDAVLRLYHLYPGAIRCRNDLGMLPLHHVFMYGNEDRILELFVDVFPEAMTVVDDKGRLPLGCTPQDGSENERRSNILDLYSKFHVEQAMKEKEGKSSSNDKKQTKANHNATALAVTPQRQPLQPLQRANAPLSSKPPVQSPDTVPLGIAAPRYTMTTDFNHVSYEAMRAHAKSQDPTTALRPIMCSRLELEDEKSFPDIDRYASNDESGSENKSDLANLQNQRAKLKSELMKFGGLEPIKEDGVADKSAGGKKVRRGIKKWFKRSNRYSI